MSSITLFANIVGKTVIVDTIRESTSSIYSILSSNPIELNTHLEIYDFENRLKIIDALLDELKPNENKHKALKLSLESIKKTIDKIHKNIDILNKQVVYHNTKWFKNWRQPEYNKTIKDLDILSNKLDKNFDILLKVINIEDKI